MKVRHFNAVLVLIWIVFMVAMYLFLTGSTHKEQVRQINQDKATIAGLKRENQYLTAQNDLMVNVCIATKFGLHFQFAPPISVRKTEVVPQKPPAKPLDFIPQKNRPRQ